jgi:hypothetical protein
MLFGALSTNYLRDLALAKMLLSKVRAPVYINPELGANEGLDKMVDTIKSSMLSGGELLRASSGKLKVRFLMSLPI